MAPPAWSNILPVSMRRRDDNECPVEQYTAPNGLNFQTYCNQEFGEDVDVIILGFSTQADDPVDCLNECSTRRPPCSGVQYRSVTGTCFFLDRSEDLENPYLVDSVDDAIAVASSSQLQPPSDTSCPYDPNSYQLSENDEEFIILCDQDFGGCGDFCPDSLGEFDCPIHSDSLADCMDVCSHSHPLFALASARIPIWIKDMESNSYLKNDTTAEESGSTVDLGFVTHSAQVTPAFNDINTDCPDENPFPSQNGSESDVKCYNTRIDTQNITYVHEPGIAGCIQTCATYSGNGAGSQEYLGVVFDMSMTDGYENCALLNDTGSAYPNPPRNATFALVTGSSQQEIEEDSSDKQSGGSSQAWIAGPVVGGVLALLLIAVGIFWYRRRRAKMGKPKALQSEAPATMQSSERRLYEVHSESREPNMLPTERQHYELQDPKSEATLQHEVEGGRT